MAKIIVKMIGSGIPEDPLRVNLPTYIMIGEPDYTNKTVLVEVPDDEINIDTGKLDRQKIRKKYAKNPKWDTSFVLNDV